jgi:tetratricopeptide (TPR) repeat protein
LHLRRAIELSPQLASAWSKLGFIYGRLNRFEASIEVLERAATLDPNDVNVLNRLGYALVRTEQYERGRDFFQRVCEATPDENFGARLNLANASFHVGDFAVARDIYEDILARAPHHYEARWNLSHLLLGDARFEEGWREYDYRWMVPAVWKPRLIPFEPWNGQPLEGKTLLVSAEQGLGDEIMFASCIPDVARQARCVIVECDARLQRLFERSFPGTIVIGSERELLVPGQQSLGSIDYHVPLASLPLHLRNRQEDFPRHSGYLHADPNRIEHWRGRLAALGAGRKIGISWRGGTADTRTSMRSLELEQLLPLLRLPGLSFVSLQYGNCAAEIAAVAQRFGVQISFWPEAIENYDETAALCCALDQTVSVCTSVIHLNGALGREVWILVPAVPEWRYGYRGESMPWYPSARLFRQSMGEEWKTVVERLVSALTGRT